MSRCAQACFCSTRSLWAAGSSTGRRMVPEGKPRLRRWHRRRHSCRTSGAARTAPDVREENPDRVHASLACCRSSTSRSSFRCCISSEPSVPACSPAGPASRERGSRAYRRCIGARSGGLRRGRAAKAVRRPAPKAHRERTGPAGRLRVRSVLRFRAGRGCRRARSAPGCRAASFPPAIPGTRPRRSRRRRTGPARRRDAAPRPCRRLRPPSAARRRG